MAIEATESASARLRTHLVGYIAPVADGSEQYRLAHITGADARPTEAERAAALPDHLRSEYIATQLHDASTIVLGPAGTEPGHPAWCTDHDDEIGDGTSVCSGDTINLPEGDVTAFLLSHDGNAPRVHLAVDEDGARLSLEGVRHLIAALSGLLAQAESAVAR